jgi:hypothetical protein
MPTYRANIRVENLRGSDPTEVREALEAKLAKAEVGDCRVLSVDPVRERQVAAQASRPTRRIPPAEGAWRRQSNAGGLILLLAVGWAAWFFWSFVSLYLSNAD